MSEDNKPAMICAEQLGDYITGFMRLTAICGPAGADAVKDALVALRDQSGIATIVAVADAAATYAEQRGYERGKAEAAPAAPATPPAPSSTSDYTDIEKATLRTWKGGNHQRMPDVVRREIKRMLHSGCRMKEAQDRFNVAYPAVKVIQEEVEAERRFAANSDRGGEREQPGGMPAWAVQT